MSRTKHTHTYGRVEPNLNEIILMIIIDYVPLTRVVLCYYLGVIIKVSV